MTNVNKAFKQLFRRHVPLSALLVFVGAVGLAYGAAKIADELGPIPELPAPSPSESAVNFSTVIDWPQGQAPNAPEGFVVHRFAEGLISPRWAYVLPNGDVLIAESSTEPKPEMPEEFARGS
jgi:glucose/arabinose dehydrogenase